MPYLNLALALFTGAYALYYVSQIARAGLTKAKYKSALGLPLDAAGLAVAGTACAMNAAFAIEGFAA